MRPEPDTKFQIATIQALMKRLFYPSNENDRLPVDQYDCIVVDECHRGYTLDREMSEDELTFRDEADYVSKYRRVLEYFDAVKIGLTATPALHTTEIFGQPVFNYSYRRAVIDGYLIDHEPPIRIVTGLAEDGMVWKAGDQMKVYDPEKGEIDLITLPDEVFSDVEEFNRRVITENFNRVVCRELARQIAPSLDEKTLIFCVNDSHADLVVKLLKEAFDEQYQGVDDDSVMKLTGQSDRPRELIRRYKNEKLPRIAVTVDLLTTGVDVPEIVNLVFIRRVQSRILYDQMIGRATRLCPEIGKEVFHIFDAVNLYADIGMCSSMKPVVANPSYSLAQLAAELQTVVASPEQEPFSKTILEQIIAKLQRKKRMLKDDTGENLAQVAGMPMEGVIRHLQQASPAEASQWLAERPQFASFLDSLTGPSQKLVISEHADELRRVERGYGHAVRPEDYLESFTEFIRENLNRIPALLVVTQRPRELTRQQLKELKLTLDQAGFSEANLTVAWREMTNEEMAASIIGFIRSRALGEALIPYSDRVDQAMKRILGSRAWTTPQRQWLHRIAKQIKLETIVDRDSFEQGAFKSEGGYSRFNKTFDGRLDQVLADINDEMWKETA